MVVGVGSAVYNSAKHLSFTEGYNTAVKDAGKFYDKTHKGFQKVGSFVGGVAGAAAPGILAGAGLGALAGFTIAGSACAAASLGAQIGGVVVGGGCSPIPDLDLVLSCEAWAREEMELAALRMRIEQEKLEAERRQKSAAQTLNLSSMIKQSFAQLVMGDELCSTLNRYRQASDFLALSLELEDTKKKCAETELEMTLHHKQLEAQKKQLEDAGMTILNAKQTQAAMELIPEIKSAMMKIVNKTLAYADSCLPEVKEGFAPSLEALIQTSGRASKEMSDYQDYIIKVQEKTAAVSTQPVPTFKKAHEPSGTPLHRACAKCHRPQVWSYSSMNKGRECPVVTSRSGNVDSTIIADGQGGWKYRCCGYSFNANKDLYCSSCS